MNKDGSIYHLRDMVGHVSVQTPIEIYGYVRAVPSPFRGGLVCRIRGAWAVIKGQAYAIEWPKAGDLEKALK